MCRVKIPVRKIFLRSSQIVGGKVFNDGACLTLKLTKCFTVSGKLLNGNKI